MLQHADLMKSGLSFLLASRRCEIGELEALARTSDLVAAVANFTHAIQRERGVSNVFLGSQGRQFASEREQQIAACLREEQAARDCFDALDTEGAPVRNGARLFSRIAVVLHGLESLPRLRADVAAMTLTPREATSGYSRLINGLLGVVFEAADSANDPQVSRALAAMFNYMQGKEFAGLERACGASVFASGQAEAASQQHWRHLIDSQQACFQVFADLAEAPVLNVEQASIDLRGMAELERLRRIALGAGTPARVDTSLSRVWYDCCTRRIDAMREVERVLAEHLRQLCERRIALAREELRNQQAALEALSAQAEAATAEGPAPLGPHLERSILGLVQEQTRRLQSVSDQLEAVRATLNERKVVERAKGLLMAHRQLSEAEAYKALRQLAMNQNRRLADVAESVLAMAEVLPAPRSR